MERGVATVVRRCLFLVLDGLGDWGFSRFGGKTPLECARTPNLDALASRGMTGLYHALRPGVPLPSEMAHFLMFGGNGDDFPGRGYLEALGYDIPPAEGDVALLARVFGVEKRRGGFVLVDEKPRIPDEEAHVLQVDVAHFAAEGLELSFRPTKGVGGILRISGGASPLVSDTNPIQEGRAIMKACPLEEAGDDEAARKTCRALNEYILWSFDRLSRNPVNRRRKLEGLPPVNLVGTQRAGAFRPARAFSDSWGLRAGAFVSGPIFFGLCRYLGMDIFSFRDTGMPGRDLKERLSQAIADEDHDFLFVHTKAPDEAAHTKDPLVKREAIEALDGGLSGLQDELEKGETLLVVVADHSTPSGGAMIHGGGTVPLLMAGPHVRRDGVSRFGEVACASGALGQLRGEELMLTVLDQMDRGQLLGLRQGPRALPWFPVECEALES
jgi:2,3-bisphosphoglycerate-independent phosphoglycerate mutase